MRRQADIPHSNWQDECRPTRKMHLQNWCLNGKANAADLFALGAISQREPIKA
jgi:hypothetical protein